MDFWQQTNWFAVHTKRFRETLAASSVRALGLEAFLPMVKLENARDAVIKVESKPLFPSYFFARFVPATSLTCLEGARGILHVIKAGPLPVPVDSEVVAELEARVHADGLIRLQRRDLRVGDRVSIEKGACAGLVGRVEAEPDDHQRVSILLEVLWNARVLVQAQWLERATR